MADILSIGSSGLSAYRRSLEVTGNNIVNANTEGYARRDVQLQGVGEAASSPTTLKTGSGSGVAIDVIRRATDVFVQSEKRVTQSASSAATALADRLDRLEKAMFSGDGNLGSLSQTLFSRLQDFATTPSSIAVRTTVIQAANDLADGFNVQANRLNAEAEAVVSDAQSELDHLNALTKQLVALNKQIDSIGGDQGKANDLLDQRDKLVDGIVKIIGVTVESRPSGAVNLYIGDGTAGPELVSQSGAKDLVASRVNGQLLITMDPYGASIPLSKIKGGTVGGIQAFDDQIKSMAGQLDRMAVGFAKRINDQHVKGTDLDGKKGLAVFSTDTLSISASKSNKGISTATIDLGQIGAIETGEYRATYSQSDAKWTIVNTTSGVKAAGTDRVSIDGMTVSFSGKPADGDLYTFSPLTKAASAMRVLIDEPRQLAASLPQLAEAVIGNQSSATIDITRTGGIIAAPPLPSLSELFTQSSIPNNRIDFKQDGIVSSIPAGSGPLSLYSFGEVSAATFRFDPNPTGSSPDVSTLSVLGNAKLRLTINGVTTPDLELFPVSLFPNGPTDAALQGDPAQALADEINRVLAEHTGTSTELDKLAFASAANGYVTINALGTSEIAAATLTGSNSSGSATAAITQKVAASEIDLVTREGIQLSGAHAIPSSSIKTSNGFMAEAQTPQIPIMTPDSSGTIRSLTYRSVQVTEVKSPIANQQSIAQGLRTSTVKFDVTADSDSPGVKNGSSSSFTPGAVYSLSVDGLTSPIRLAGNAIIGKSSAEITSLMADRLNQLAPQRSLIGSAITLPNDLSTSSFKVTINGVASEVTFTRSRNADTGAALAGGTFTVKGDPRLSVSMVPSDPSNPTGTQRLLISLPKALSTATQTISITGDALSDLGLSNGAVTEQIIGSQKASVDLATSQATLNAQFGLSAGAVSLTSDNRILITKTLSGSLSSLTLTNLSTDTESHRDDMTAIGYVGSDLTLTQSETALGLTSKISVPAGSTPNLTDTSETVSRIGQKIKIASTVTGHAIPEDLLVSIQQSQTSGARTLAATYDQPLTRVNPTLPDIEADITAAGIVSLYALKTDSSGNLLRDTQGNLIRGDLIAKRAYQPGMPVDYMGAQFIIDGNATIGDKFRITTDPARTGDNRNALALIDVGRSDLIEKGSGTFADIYAAAVSKIGSSTQAAKTSAAAAKTVADNVAAAYDSATGVNLDAEAAELIKLQQAYSACAQIVSTARDMFEMILKAF